MAAIVSDTTKTKTTEDNKGGTTTSMVDMEQDGDPKESNDAAPVPATYPSPGYDHVAEGGKASSTMEAISENESSSSSSSAAAATDSSTPPIRLDPAGPGGSTTKDTMSHQQHHTDNSNKQSPPPLPPTSSHTRMWGTPPQDGEHGEHLPHEDDRGDVAATTAAASSSSSSFNAPPRNVHHIPFKPKTSASSSSSATHPPPPGFQITTRVYIEPRDKLAYIDEDPITLPYWDCGTVGSTTTPLTIKEVTFRHSLTQSQAWTGTDGKHPFLCVALTEFLLEVSSGASKVIQPGQVVLLEDVLIPGHKLRPLHHHDVQVMFLQLPKTHYSTGKESISLPTTVVNDPCPIPERMSSSSSSSSSSYSKNVVKRGERDARLLRILLGLTGASLFTIMADFLGKTAPLWLAVGVGGSCFVTAGTVGTIALGEACVSNLQAWIQQRRLQSKTATPDDDLEVSVGSRED
jgi:hypothetical protein